MNVPRIEYGLDAQVYRDAPGLSHSDSKRLRKSPYHFFKLAEPHERPPKASTPQQIIGTLAHAALLEPEVFESRYLVGPDVNKNSNVWKEFAAGCARVGAEPIDARMREQALGMAGALRGVPEVAELMTNGAAEVSMWWHCPRSGVLCKGRPDYVGIVGTEPQSVVLLDVKSTDDASAEEFAKSVANWSYHTQADWYCEGYAIASGLEVHGMLFAVVEREFPYACAAYMLDDEALRKAREKNDEVRALYAQCKRDNKWPGYPGGVQVLSLPRWA